MLGIDKLIKWTTSRDADVSVTAPIIETFAAVSDVRFIRELLGRNAFPKVSDGAIQLGDKYSLRTEAGTVHTLEVIEFVPSERIVLRRELRGSGVSGDTRYSLILNEVAGGTKLTYQQRATQFGIFLGAMTLILMPIVLLVLLPYRLVDRFILRLKLRHVERVISDLHS